jgi:hypothetical protein
MVMVYRHFSPELASAAALADISLERLKMWAIELDHDEAKILERIKEYKERHA